MLREVVRVALPVAVAQPARQVRRIRLQQNVQSFREPTGVGFVFGQLQMRRGDQFSQPALFLRVQGNGAVEEGEGVLVTLGSLGVLSAGEQIAYGVICFFFTSSCSRFNSASGNEISTQYLYRRTFSGMPGSFTCQSSR